MCHDYKPTGTSNGVKNKENVRCYIAVTSFKCKSRAATWTELVADYSTYTSWGK